MKVKMTIGGAVLAVDFSDEICGCITSGEIRLMFNKVITKTLYKSLQNQALCNRICDYINYTVHRDTNETVNAVIYTKAFENGVYEAVCELDY
jgi:hypothetical protein